MKDKDIKDIINNIDDLKGYEPSEEDILILESLSENYKDKSEDDIFVEIIRLNNEMEEGMTEEQYESIFEKLNSIRPILSEEQSAKLDKILEVLNRDR